MSNGFICVSIFFPRVLLKFLVRLFWHSRNRPHPNTKMDAALAAVLPHPVSLGSAGAIIAGAAEAAAAAATRAGIGSTSTRLPSTSTSSSPKLQGLVLVSDSLGADAAFVISHLLLKCLRDGQRVVLVATAESGPHHEAVLRKLGLASLTPPSLEVVPLWDDDALWMPDSMRMQSCGATGLRRAAQAIQKAIGEEGDRGEDESENGNNTVLVFDSLSALQAAARDAREWEGFVACQVLGAKASCVVARTDCVPGDEGRAGAGGDGDDDGECGEEEASEPGGSSSSSSSHSPPPWLAALRSAASVELTTRPLASGAAIDVSGVLVVRRGVTATMATATPTRQRVGEEEPTPAAPSLAPLSLGSTTPLFAALPPRSRAVFNYRLVDAAVRLVPRRTL